MQNNNIDLDRTSLISLNEEDTNTIEKLDIDKEALAGALDHLDLTEEESKTLNEYQLKMDELNENKKRIEELNKQIQVFKENEEENKDQIINLEKEVQEKEAINSELKKTEPLYNELMNTKIINDNIKKKYQNLLDATNSLVDKLNEFYTPNEKGELKKVNKKDREDLLNIYQNVANSTGAVLDITRNPKKTNIGRYLIFEDKFKHLADISKKIEDYVSKDIRAIIKMKDEATLPDVIKNGRIRTIDISGQSISKVGGNMSSRQIIEENGKKAVFTETSFFIKDNEVEKNINKYCAEYPEYEKYFKMFNRDSNCYNDNSLVIFTNFDEKGNVNFTYQDMTSMDLNPTLMLDEFDLSDAMKKDPLLCTVMYNYLSDAAKIANVAGFNGHMGLNKNEDAAERNSGMSVIAELLGFEDLICHSEPVKIKNGDKVVKGTLMDFAEGTDVNGIKPGDDIAKYTGDEIKVTANVKKQISNLQILDLICGNIDRHGANLFYKYDLSNPENPKIIGVQGIDNDSSFIINENGTKNIVEGYNRMVGLHNLNVIDEQTKNRILAVSPAMLRLSLKGMDINENCIEALVTRYTCVQQVLRDKRMTKDATHVNEQVKLEKSVTVSPGKYKIRLNVIKNDDMWEDLDVSDAYVKTKHSNNLFNVLTTRKLGGANEMSFFYNDVQNLMKENLKAERSINEHNKSVVLHINELNNKSKLFRSSDEYRKVQKDMKLLNDKKDEIKKRFNPEDFLEYSNLINDAINDSQLYLNKKEREKQEGKEFSQYTLDRIAAVTALRDNLLETVDEITKSALGPYNMNQLILSKKQKDIENNDRMFTSPEYQKAVINAHLKAKKKFNPQLIQNLKKDINKDIDLENPNMNKSVSPVVGKNELNKEVKIDKRKSID